MKALGVDKDKDIYDSIVTNEKMVPVVLANIEDSENTELYPYEKKLQLLGEDPQDAGGYFIIGGTERTLISMEDLAPNKIIVNSQCLHQYHEWNSSCDRRNQLPGKEVCCMAGKRIQGKEDVSDSRQEFATASR